MPPLAGNATLAQPDGINLVQVMAKGIAPQSLDQAHGYGPMPSFKDRLSPAQMTELANYLRAAFAPGEAELPPLTEAEITKVLQQ